MFIQFFGSTMTVSFTLYQLTKISSTSVEYAKMSLYMYCMLIQIYLYCWYGNLVTLKSEEIVYQMFDTNLMELSNDIKKSLLIMMYRTTRPIVIIVMNLFPLNIESFLSILKTAYTAYNFLEQTLLVSSLSLSQMIGIASIAIDSGEVSDDIYVFLAHFVSCFKLLCLVINRNNIVKLIDTLGQEPYRPLDDMETNIQTKFDKLSRFNIHSYVSLITFTVSHFLFMSLITDFRKRQLTFRAWLPFDDSMTPVVFYLTYAHQMVALTLGAVIHVALDTLISDLLLNICCQIRILENRLTNITNERKVILKLCIRHHECIYGFAADVNKTFKFAIFVQFLASTFTVCFTLFQITKISVNSLEFLKMTLFMFGMLIQVYLYCWYGNLVTVKHRRLRFSASADAGDLHLAFLISTVSLSQGIGIVLNEGDSNDSSDDIYVFFAILISCFKMLSLMINRNKIVNFVGTLTQKPYKPSDGVETRIQIKFDNWSSLLFFYRLADKVNKMFEFTIFIQFFITTSTICFTLYQLTKVSPISFECVKILIYIICILTQIYLYCWYGNLVETKSEEIATIIFNIDWITLSDDIRKNLLFMMKRTMKPIAFVVIRILPVNFDSFVKVLKTSYSAYNILQQTQGK
ncbi:uncharacterized protein LOC124430467 [Vespa crabro]|uniref:uncharacterized protein LOC124430467 n=1 Tax=Vespa crabro TaxID=7445 RepID=UPI001F029191|nr:uncharacterized protein LOC124430467 [Vespa crabro]